MTGKFDYLPISEYEPPERGRSISYTYSDIASRLRVENLENLVKEALRQRLEIISGRLKKLLNELSGRRNIEFDKLLEEILNKLRHCGVLDDFDESEIRDYLSNRDQDSIINNMVNIILNSTPHFDPVTDEKGNILSYGDHPGNPHGIALEETKKGSIILFVARLVPWIKNKKTYVIRDDEQGDYLNKVVKRLESALNSEECRLNGEERGELYREIMYIPYVHDYYFIGYLIVEDIVKLDEIVERLGWEKARKEMEQRAESDRRIRENPHYCRFKGEEDAMWIFLGGEGSRLFDNAVILSNDLLKEIKNHIIYLDCVKRFNLDRVKKFNKRKKPVSTCKTYPKHTWIRGSWIVKGEGVDIIRDYLRRYGVEIEL